MEMKTEGGTIAKTVLPGQDSEDGPAIRNRLSSRSITLAEAGHGRVNVFSNLPPFLGGGWGWRVGKGRRGI